MPVLDPIAALAGLFVFSFFAATILPGSSEAALVALILTDRYSVVALFLAATAGNTAGGAANWAIGRWLGHLSVFRTRLDPAKIERATVWFRRYGAWSLLLSWVPIIGDPLTVAAGLLRIGFVPFLVLVAIGKATRYAVLVAVIRP